MKDLEIINQLLNDYHLSNDELIKASSILKLLSIEVKVRQLRNHQGEVEYNGMRCELIELLPSYENTHTGIKGYGATIKDVIDGELYDTFIEEITLI